ncbi:hypothetical protein B5S27_g5659 [[Candida] boidinii]|nr:hypothetical protein B5S27_g5659 [[Candida] boidinii]
MFRLNNKKTIISLSKIIKLQTQFENGSLIRQRRFKSSSTTSTPSYMKQNITKKQSSSNSNKNENEKDSSSSSSSSAKPQDSFTVQLLFLVTAMFAGYSLGKSIILNHPPSYLFPIQSTSDIDDLSTVQFYGSKIHLKGAIHKIFEEIGIPKEKTSEVTNKLVNSNVIDLALESRGFTDILFGSTLYKWFSTKYKDDKDSNGELKNYILYPTSSKQVATIVKYCQDYKIPLFTINNVDGKDTNSLNIPFESYHLIIDLKNLNRVIEFNENENYIHIERSINPNDLKQILVGKNLTTFTNNHHQQDETLNQILNSIGLNIKSNSLIDGKLPIDSIIEYSCCLPDGSNLNLTPKDELFPVFLNDHYNSNFGIITELKLKLIENTTDTNNNNNNNLILIYSFDDLDDINLTIKNFNKILNENFQDLNYSFIDKQNSFVNNKINSIFKNSNLLNFDNKSILLFKLNNIDKNSKLIKILNKSIESNNLKFESKLINELELNNLIIKDSIYLSNLNNLKISNELLSKFSKDYNLNLNNNSIILNDDILNNDFKIYYEIPKFLESKLIKEINKFNNKTEENSVNDNLIRKLKLSIDPNRTLNPNVSILLDKDI